MELSQLQQDGIKNFTLYGVTDIKNDSDEILRQIDQAYSGGADIIQMRSKTLSDKEFYHLGLKIREIANKHKKLLFVNDRLDLALALEADGLHIGQDDLPVKKVRQMANRSGHPLLIGKSTHSLLQALQTSQEDIDYIGVGPIFATPTKPAYPAIGYDIIHEIKKNIRVPFVTIGGIDTSNLEEVLKAGASRIAIVRAIFDTGDVYESTKRIKETIERFNNHE